MAFQFSVAVRDGRLNSIETTIGASAKLEIYSGAEPANCATADAGTLLATLTLPATYFGTAASGSMALAGVWTGTAATAGTAGHFRLMDPTGATCHAQGSCTATGGGGDMTIDNPVLAVGQVFNVTSFTVTDGNA